jgi:hypothetical protein
MPIGNVLFYYGLVLRMESACIAYAGTRGGCLGQRVDGIDVWNIKEWWVRARECGVVCHGGIMVNRFARIG